MRKLISIAAAGGLLAATSARAAVDFQKEIAPIFQESCLKCHGPDKQKGDLRLDSKAAAFKGGKDGLVITPGNADKSDLYRRVILPEGNDDVMPSKGDLLTKKQTDLIRDWINEGANWPEGTVTQVAEAPAEVSPYAGLTPVKASPEETAAIAKIESSGVMVRTLATNVTWREASFRARGTNITDASLVPLKNVPSLVDLNLSRTKVTDAGLQNIAGLTNLVDLHLEQTQIGDAGLVNLKKLSHLVYLNLYATPVTDAGLESLKGLESLRHLYLWGTKVTAQGAADLQKALPKLEISRGWENEPAAQTVQAKAPDSTDAKK
jgi:mono/diheme cytochrome c family protein